MTTYSFETALQTTEFFENAPFYNMPSGTTWGDSWARNDNRNLHNRRAA